MDDTETPTLTPSETPIPAEAPVETATPETPEPAAAPEAVEGVEEGVEPTVETPAWATVTDVEELFENPEVQAHHARSVQEAHDTAYSELQGHMQPLLQGNKQTLEQIASASESIVTTLNRAVEDQVLDKRAVEDLMRTHRNEFAALNQTYQVTGYWEGVKQYTQALLGNDAPMFLTRLDKMQQDIPDPTFAADIQKKVREAGRKEGYDEGFRKGSKQGQSAATQQAAIKGAKNTGPNLAPGTPSNRGDDNKRLLDKTTPIDEIREIRARQKAAGE